MGLFISNLSKSASFNRENLAPSSPFFCTWFTILSSMPIWRKNVDMSSAENSCRLPSFGISISCSGMNFCFAANIIKRKLCQFYLQKRTFSAITLALYVTKSCDYIKPVIDTSNTFDRSLCRRHTQFYLYQKLIKTVQCEKQTKPVMELHVL